MKSIELRTFTEQEYHDFFREYISDSFMNSSPFVYNREQISRSYAYNHGGYRTDYEHFGIFMEGRPVGSFQLKRINRNEKKCEFGIILQNDSVKDMGIGSEAIRQSMRIARDKYGMETLEGETMSSNTRMIRVFEKLGFSLTETVPSAYRLPDGSIEDRLVYQISLTGERL